MDYSQSPNIFQLLQPHTTHIMVIKQQDLAQNGLIDAATFSFDQATLDSNLQNNLAFRAYDRAKPNTWPLITLTNLNKHCRGKYEGDEMLPHYLAYDSNVMAVFLTRHRKRELTEYGTGASLYSRWPCNFTMRDRVKTFVGMSAEEQAGFESEMAAKQKADIKKGKQPERGESSNSTTTFTMRPAASKGFCQTPACVKERDEKDELKTALRDREEDLKASRKETRDIVQRNACEVKALRTELEAARRDAQERRTDQVDRTESGLRNMVNEGRIRELEKKCEELKVEVRRLKGESMPDKRARVEDYFSEDEERPEKKARSG